MNAREAVNLMGHLKGSDMLAVQHLQAEIRNLYATGQEFWAGDISTPTAVALWNAGRVQGIREERARKNRNFGRRRRA